MELIAALLHQPRLLLLDEPTIGLDVVAQVAIQKCLREYHARRGVTMLLTSHYMRDVEALCERVLVITHGMLGLRRRRWRASPSVRHNRSSFKLEFAEEDAPEGLERFGEVDAHRGAGGRSEGRSVAGGRDAGRDPGPATRWPTSACRTRRWNR